MKLNNIRKTHEEKFLSTYIANYTNDNGVEVNYEIVSRNKHLNAENISNQKEPNAVSIIAFNEDKTKVLVQAEFRLAVNRDVINIPGGLIDDGEDAVTAAKRELWEETGLELYDIETVLPGAYTAVGVSDESVATVIGKARGDFAKSTNDDEEIAPRWISKSEALDMIRNKVSMTLRTQTLLWLWATS